MNFCGYQDSQVNVHSISKIFLQNMTAKTLRYSCMFFIKKKTIKLLGSHVVVFVETFPFDASITNVRPILTKLGCLGALTDTIRNPHIETC